MIPKAFDQIVKDDIDALVANSVSESRTLDYKLALPTNTDADKKEFLADVSAFANTSGGDLLYGVDEQRDASKRPTGQPSTAPGLSIPTVDAELQRLQSILQTGVEPQIPGVQVKAIPGFPRGHALLLHVPKSWVSPHMVTFKGSSRFYARNSNGKYQLDLPGIRSAFLASETTVERTRDFRLERIAHVAAGETPVPLNEGPKAVLHVVPISALDPTNRVDVTPKARSLTNWLQPVEAQSNYDLRSNLDGLLLLNGRDNRHSYVQLFRSGALEAAGLIASFTSKDGDGISTQLEWNILKALGSYLTFFRETSASLPLIVMLTFTGMAGWRLVKDERIPFPLRAFDRDTLPLPDVMVEDYQVEPAKLMWSVFEVLWQAGGQEHCPRYDGAGNWVAGKHS